MTIPSVKDLFLSLWCWMWRGEDPSVWQSSHSWIKMNWEEKEREKKKVLSCQVVCIGSSETLLEVFQQLLHVLLPWPELHGWNPQLWNKGKQKSGSLNWSVLLFSNLFSLVVELVMPFWCICSTVLGFYTHAYVLECSCDGESRVENIA